MARNPSSGFRKIDVDQYGDDVFKEDENAETHSPAIGVDEQEVRRLIQAGKYGDALRNLLTSAPLSSKNPSVKDNAYNLVLQVLLSVKASEIDKVLESLNEDVALIDVLMKYIYRGFETPTDNSSASLLIWHEKTFALGGVGSVVRVLTDKKRV